MQTEEIRCIVKGKVQGVFFRDFVVKHARHLALTGYVRNTSDFMVEVVAQGYHDRLEKLIAHLRKGPFLARVSDVHVEWRQAGEQLENFEVVF
ncbi:MAG: acylphosphatase [Candidatus Kaiserbacteria bacterium]|nr:MAG: acylphosphatase [Candidatus Kaiserbacteria bacterium]